MAAPIMGRLGKNNLAATTETSVYTVPSDRSATVNIHLVNRNTVPARIRLAIAAGASAGASEWLEYDEVLYPGQSLGHTGVTMSEGERVNVYSTVANVTVRVHGIEEDE